MTSVGSTLKTVLGCAALASEARRGLSPHADRGPPANRQAMVITMNKDVSLKQAGRHIGHIGKARGKVGPAREPDRLAGREVPGLERYSTGFVSMASFALRSDMAPGEV